MVSRLLLKDQEIIKQFRNATVLCERGERLYIDHISKKDSPDNAFHIDTLELVVSLENIVRIRDWLNKRIQKIENHRTIKRRRI